MATPVRPATASCPACFHVLPAWRLLTSQTPLSTITYKTSSSFFHFFSSSLLTKKSVYSGQTRSRPSSSRQSFRNKKTRRGYTLDLIPPINFAIFFFDTIRCYTRINIEHLEVILWHALSVQQSWYILNRLILFILYCLNCLKILSWRHSLSTWLNMYKRVVCNKSAGRIKLERSNVRKGR